MHDPRLDRLAHVLVCHSTKIQPDEAVLIEVFDIPDEMVVALVRAVRQAGNASSAVRSSGKRPW